MIKTKIQSIIKSYSEEIKTIERQDLNDFNNVENGIQISRKYIKQLRLILRNNKFQNSKDEITFFKEQKPFVNARVKFYSKLYQFLLQRPQGSIQKQREFIDAEIEKLQSNYRKNLDFIKYYRENSIYLDKYYFRRGKDEVKLVSDTSHYLTDSEFSTSHDNLVAKIMAFDLLVGHYQELLTGLRFREKNESSSKGILDHYVKRGFKWTANKTDLIELIYALQTSGAIEDGQTAIKAMVEACEELFELDLGNAYRTYLEIKERKMDRTRFINQLKTSLERRMNKDDEKY